MHLAVLSLIQEGESEDIPHLRLTPVAGWLGNKLCQLVLLKAPKGYVRMD
jgi:hypothetical protein